VLPGQRLALARVFANQSGFLLMAEPYGQLNAQPRGSMGKEPAGIWGAEKQSIETQLLLQKWEKRDAFAKDLLAQDPEFFKTKKMTSGGMK
jgi:ABC-type Fe3+/spermidine/putrescine transport system ATPase subunit